MLSDSKDGSDFSDSPIAHALRGILGDKYENRGGFFSGSQLKFLTCAEVEKIVRSNPRDYNAPDGWGGFIKLIADTYKKYSTSLDGHGLDIVRDIAHSRLAVDDNKKEDKDKVDMEGS